LLDRLQTLLARSPIVPAGQAAMELGVSEDHLVSYARGMADCFGLLDGPPPVLYRLVNEPAQA
jgi:hypothetical protein